MIAEILKNCPEGTKLYSPVWGNVELIKVNALNNIEIRDSNEIKYIIYPNGKYSENGEVILFPSKEQYNWDEFLIPFENGDIIVTTDITDTFPYENIAIFKEYREKNFRNKMIIHCQFDADGNFIPREMDVLHKNWRLANAEEIQRFVTRINELGYDFKDGKFTEKFKYGDVVAMYNEQYQHTHIAIFDKYIGDKFMKVVCTNLANSNTIKVFGESKHWYKQGVRYATEKEKEFFFNLLKEQNYVWTGKELVKRFNLDNYITNGVTVIKITKITDNYYFGYNIKTNEAWSLPLHKIKDWDLAKFDICSLKPYDRVLVKSDTGCWYPTLVSYVESSEVYLIDTDDLASYVIPFEGNEHLIGKFDDPDPYYVTWE